MQAKKEIKQKLEESIKNPKYYKHSSHATYNLTWHCVWITKYRRKIITEEIQKRLETIIRWVCKENYVNILWLWFEKDHVHLLLSFPITFYIPDIFRLLKWRTSKIIRVEFKDHLKEYYKSRWNKHLWAVWYFFCSVWKIDEEIIKNYVESQWEEDCRWKEISLT